MVDSAIRANGYSGFLGHVMIFGADPFDGEVEPWRTDGTPGGTMRIKAIDPGGNPNPTQFSPALKGFVYFQADDGINGRELWRTDGTGPGTTPVMNINPSGDSGPANFALAGDRLYFVADDGTHGHEPWWTDGTTTMMLADLNPGSGDSFPDRFTPLGPLVFFMARDAGGHMKLWLTDGTMGGTEVAVTFPEDLLNFYVVGDTIFALTSDTLVHRHVWRWRPGEAAPVSLGLEFTNGSFATAIVPGMLLVLSNVAAGVDLDAIALCGDGLVRGGEVCDGGACCTATCTGDTGAACDDGNTCTVTDVCSATATCGGTVVGFPETETSLGAPLRAGACASTRVPGALASRLKHGASLVKRGQKAKKPKTARKLVRAALGLVTKGETAAGKVKGHVPAACKAELVARFGEAVSRVGCLLGRL
jgi:ELWxxDGT repeat protein